MRGNEKEPMSLQRMLSVGYPGDWFLWQEEKECAGGGIDLLHQLGTYILSQILHFFTLEPEVSVVKAISTVVTAFKPRSFTTSTTCIIDGCIMNFAIQDINMKHRT